MHTIAHDPHISEIQQAFSTLLYERKIRSQAQVARTLGISAAHFGDILAGKKSLTAELKEKFESAYDVKLSRLKKPVALEIKPGEVITLKDFMCSRLVFLEIQNEVMFELLAEVLGKKPAEIKKVKRRIAAKVDLKVQSMQALIIDE